MFLTESAAEPDTQNIRSPKNYQKGTLFQKQKDRYCLQSMCQGNAKWYLIMSTKSTFPTELASQPDTQNIRSFKKHQKGLCSRDKKTPIGCKACGREMQNSAKSCLCFLRKQLLSQILRTSEVPKITKGTLFQRQKDPYQLQSMWEGNAKQY